MTPNTVPAEFFVCSAAAAAPATSQHAEGATGFQLTRHKQIPRMIETTAMMYVMISDVKNPSSSTAFSSLYISTPLNFRFASAQRDDWVDELCNTNVMVQVRQKR